VPGGWDALATPAAAWRTWTALKGHCDEPLGLAAVRFADTMAKARGTLGEDHGQPPIRKTDAWSHQRQAFWYAYHLDACLLAMGMGCGKSKVAIDLIANWRCQKTLILCPTSVRAVWRREIDRHYPGPVSVIILDRGTIDQRVRAADKAWRLSTRSGKPLIIVINYEAAWRDTFAAWALAQHWDCVVCDESHVIKANDSNVSRFAADMGRRASRRLCLTGTPLAQTPLDAWGQYRFLDPGIFGTNHSLFRHRYEANAGAVAIRTHLADAQEALARLVDLLPDQEHLLDQCTVDLPGGANAGLRNASELQERIGLIAYHCRTQDVLDLPPIAHEDRTCRLGAEANRVYNALEASFVADIEGGTVRITNALARMVRLQQVTSGYLPDDQTHTVHRLDDAKEHLLRDLLAEAGGEPVVVFCRYRADLATVERVSQSLKLQYGELSHARKDALTDRGEMANGIQVAGVQPKSGGMGIDLTRARIAVFYSLSFSLAEFDQAVARVHRPGQTRPTSIYSLVCDRTIDRRIHTAIAGRREVVEDVLGQLHNAQCSAA